MAWRPQDTDLGKVELIKVFSYCDRPCLFSCRSEAGQLFLALWIDETDESDRWLYAPVSENVLTDIGSGDANLRSVFQNAAGGSVLEIENFLDGRSSKCNPLNCSDLTDDMLPV